MTPPRRQIRHQVDILGIDHPAYRVRTGELHMYKTNLLMYELGFMETVSRRRSNSWGEIRFYLPPGESADGFRVQLTYLLDDSDCGIDPEVHLALRVSDVSQAVTALQQWCELNNFEFSTEDGGEGKVMVYLPTLLAFAIEFVPAQQVQDD